MRKLLFLLQLIFDVSLIANHIEEISFQLIQAIQQVDSDIFICCSGRVLLFLTFEGTFCHLCLKCCIKYILGEDALK